MKNKLHSIRIFFISVVIRIERVDFRFRFSAFKNVERFR